MSVLSQFPDGLGYFYGQSPVKGDFRQINVIETSEKKWLAYVGGESVLTDEGKPYWETKDAAEQAAVHFASTHPQNE